MPVSFKELEEFRFVRSHKVTCDPDGTPKFAALRQYSATTKPAVYIWLMHGTMEDHGEALYVGKAGKGVARRCRQHEQGFVNSSTGRKNADALTTILADGTKSVTVFARDSGTDTLFGQTVSLYSAEEDALCALYKPLLNRAAFPDVSVVALPSTTVPTLPATIPMTRITEVINSWLRDQDPGTIDDLLAQVGSYSPANLTLLERMLDYIDRHLMQPCYAMKLVKGYTGQIAGCDNVTTLGFGILRHQNFAPNGWVARIYLTDPPRIAFPGRLLVTGAKSNTITQSKIEDFSPNDLNKFFSDPAQYINPPNCSGAVVGGSVGKNGGKTR